MRVDKQITAPGVQCHFASFATLSGPATKVTLLYGPLIVCSRRDLSGSRAPMREYRQRPPVDTECAGALLQLFQCLQNVSKPLILHGVD